MVDAPLPEDGSRGEELNSNATPDEELSIDGNDAAIQESDNQSASKHSINTRYGDVSSALAPGESADELIDHILQLPQEQLIPWEECMLPSKGIYYGWEDGICQVRAMGQTAEKILASQRLSSSGQSLELLFRECCRFPNGFDANELLLGDRMFLLYYLRGITHGNVYEFAVTCPNPECESVNTYKYDLNELAETITYADSAWGNEPFRINLPYLSRVTGRDIWVGVRFLRAYDANDIIARRRSRKKAFAKPGGVRSSAAKRRQAVDPRQQEQQGAILDSALDDHMEKLIINVMGVTDRLKIRALVQRLHSQDTAAIREWLREHTPGIDSTVQVTCPDCSNEFRIELPITDSFFRPAKQ